MKSVKINQEQEFKVYGEILHGRLQPQKPRFNDNTQLINLVEFANTKKLNIKISEINLSETLCYSECSKHGYKDPDDLIANIHSSNKKGTSIITIIPGKNYLLGNIMEDDIDKPPCFKSKCYLRLIIDEFERIKIRACYLLNSNNNTDQLKLIVLKNLRIAEFLLRETSAHSNFFLISELDSHKRSIHYIIDCLKKFLIKSIRFYHGFFDPYITQFFEQSEELIKNVDQATCSNCIKYLYQNDTNNNFEDSATDSNHFPNPAIQKLCNKPLLRWTGRINLLVSLFYDLMEKNIILIGEDVNNQDRVSRKRNQSRTNMNLVEFLYLSFLDSKGNRLSKDTLRTYLNPNRPDKRSKRSQDLNLDKYI